MAVQILHPTQFWECPSCKRQHITHHPSGQVASELHNCVAHALMVVPFVQVQESGLKAGAAVHRVIERSDYVGSEVGVAHDANGRAVMAVQTERSDGYDTHVFAPVAHGRIIRE